MGFKNAVSVCLISLFSATLVVLIASFLDSRAASQLKPQLASIVKELRALRKQGGGAVSPQAGASSETAADGVIVYYFHGNTRCPNCTAIEAQAKEAVQSAFAPQLESGELTWETVNFQEPANAKLAKEFGIETSVVALALMKNGQVADKKRLDEVWGLKDDKAAFRAFVEAQVTKMLAAASEPPAAARPEPPPRAQPAPPAIPIPEPPAGPDAPAKTPPAIPIPGK